MAVCSGEAEIGDGFLVALLRSADVGVQVVSERAVGRQLPFSGCPEGSALF